MAALRRRWVLSQTVDDPSGGSLSLSGQLQYVRSKADDEWGLMRGELSWECWLGHGGAAWKPACDAPVVPGWPGRAGCWHSHALTACCLHVQVKVLKGLEESLARFYVGSIVLALEYLHDHSIGAREAAVARCTCAASALVQVLCKAGNSPSQMCCGMPLPPLPLLPWPPLRSVPRSEARERLHRQLRLCQAWGLWVCQGRFGTFFTTPSTA